ncbi:hypothetical protein HY636_05935 [Candidatus Woesearchaeota archaeon]|nr:hypothetical protein [Candidatus Woesearchaeota archaeon]
MVVVEDVSGIRIGVRATDEDNLFSRRDASKRNVPLSVHNVFRKVTTDINYINYDVLDKRITQFEQSASEISDLLKGLEAFPRRCRDAGDYFDLQTFYNSEVSGSGLSLGGLSFLQLGKYMPFGQIVEKAAIDLTRKLNERKIKQKAHETLDYINSSFLKAREILFGKETIYGPEKGLYGKHAIISDVVRADKEILASVGGRIDNGNLRLVDNSAVDKAHKPINEVYCMDWNQDRLKNVSLAIGYLERVYRAINGSSFEVKLIAEKDYGVQSAVQMDKDFSKDTLRLATLLRKMAFDSVATERDVTSEPLHHAVSYQ